MIVQKTTEFTKEKISKYFHKSWLNLSDFTALLKSDYMMYLLDFLEESYNLPSYTYPLKEKIFNSFAKTDFYDLKVVIYNDFPEKNVFSSGIGFGLDFPSHNIEIPESSKVYKVREKLFEDDNASYFDESLDYWCYQGAMVLNTSLICTHLPERNKNTEKMCRNFIRNVIKILDFNKVGIIHVFTNKEQKEIFSKYIDTKYNYILEYDGIIENITDILKEIDVIFEKEVERKINWVN